MRKDIQGLRSVAVLAVLLFHFWPNTFTGGFVGVDIFFVISGFLITSHLVSNAPRGISGLFNFWGKRIRRLLPAATTVLLVSLAASLLWLPQTMLATTSKEAIAAALYVENWKLARISSNYFESTNLASPIQHFWSLSVEEQFYFVWPVIIALTFVLINKIGKTKQLLICAMSVVFLGSLALSIHYTRVTPARAYFITTTRIWELALGGLIAVIVMQTQNVRASITRVTSWAGLAAIGMSIALFDKATPFPSYYALLPTVGAALLLFSSVDSVSYSPRFFLCWRPNQVIGDISYSLYLWHWPILIITPFALHEKLSSWHKIILIAIIFVVAYASKKWIEDPGRTSRVLSGSTVRTYIFGIACAAVVVASGFAVSASTANTLEKDRQRLQEALANPGQCLGAAAARNDTCENIHGSKMVTTPLVAKSDNTVIDNGKCITGPPFTDRFVCSAGDKNSSVKVALLGNSHAERLYSPLEQAATDNNWQLDTYVSLLCYNIDMKLIMPLPNQMETDNCFNWNKWAVSTIAQSDYDLVIIHNKTGVGIEGVPLSRRDAVAEKAYEDTIQQFIDAGKKVLVVRNVPEIPYLVPDCLETAYTRSDCDVDRDVGLTPDPLYRAAQNITSSSLYTLDLTDLFCDTKKCYVTIGGMIAYRDQDHLTDSFASTLTPEFAAAIKSALGSTQ